MALHDLARPDGEDDDRRLKVVAFDLKPIEFGDGDAKSFWFWKRLAIRIPCAREKVDHIAVCHAEGMPD